MAKGGDIIGVMKRMGGQADKIGASNAAAYASTLLSLGETEETAGTSMKAIITKLSAAEKGTKKFKDAFADLGLNTSAIQKQMASDANGAIQTVMDAIAKMPKDQQTGILKDLFGLEHVGQAEKLANNMGELRRQIELTQSAAAKGSMDREVKARLDTQMAKWEMLKNKATNAMAKIGAAPQFGTLIDKLGNLAEKVGNFAERHPKLVATVLAGAAAMGALAIGVGVAQLAFARLLGPVAWAFKAFSWLRKGDGTISGMAKIASVASRVGSALTRMGGVALQAFMMLGRGVMLAGRMMLANPMILAITAIAGAGYLIYKNWDSIAPYVKSVWDKATGFVGKAWDKLKSVFTTGFHIINGLFLRFPILNYIFPITGALLALARNWGRLKEATHAALSSISRRISQAWSGIKTETRAAWDSVKTKVSGAWTSIKQSIKSGLSAAANWVKNWAIVRWFAEKWNAMVSNARAVIGQLKQVGSDIVNGLREGISAKWGEFSAWFKAKIKMLISLSKESLDSHSPSRKFIALGHDIMSGLGLGIEGKLGFALDKTRKAMQKIKQAGRINVHAPQWAGVPIEGINPPSIRRPEFAPVRNASAREFRFEMGDIHIHTTSGDPQEVARVVRRELEQVMREFDRRARSSMIDRG